MAEKVEKFPEMITDPTTLLPETQSFKMQSPIRVIVPGERVTGTLFKSAGRILLLVTVLLATVRPVMADNREGAFTLSPFAGGQGFPFDGNSHLDGDFNWGARTGYNFTQNFRIELVFGVNDTVHDPEVAFCTVYQYGADLLYAFRPEEKLVPFVSAGFGAFDVNYNGRFDTESTATEPLSDETSAYFNYGGGVEYALTSWLALRVEFHHAIMLDSGDNVFQGTVGFTFQF